MIISFFLKNSNNQEEIQIWHTKMKNLKKQIISYSYNSKYTFL